MAQNIIDFVEAIKRGYIGAGNVVGLAKDIPDKKDLVQTLWIMAAANDGFASDNLASAAQTIESHYSFDTFAEIEQSTLPEWAQSVEASAILNKLVEAGICTRVNDLISWNKKISLWVYFADKVSDLLKINGSKENGTQWEIVSLAFENITKSNCEYAKTYASKRKLNNEWYVFPKGFEKINEILNINVNN